MRQHGEVASIHACSAVQHEGDSMKRFLPALAVAVSAVFVSPWAHAQVTEVQPTDPPPAASSQTTEDVRSNWFVELKSSPQADGGSPAAMAQDRQSFLSQASDVGVQVVQRFAYEDLFNGLSVSLK